MENTIKSIIKEYKEEKFDKLEEKFNYDAEIEMQDLYTEIFKKISVKLKKDLRRLIFLIQEHEKNMFEQEKQDLLCLGIKIGAELSKCS